jgi:2-phosphosulfolactate phosphatase
MRWHIIEGIEGCRFAKEQGYSAVVVDALRASCTAAMLLDAGATDITLVPDVPTALAFKKSNPEGLLFGERDGLPPDGFDYGNSPRDVAAAMGKSVGFTTSNGTALMLEAWGAPEVYMGSVTNGLALVQQVMADDRDVVLIPAGNVADPEFSAQEDWVAASAIVMLADIEVGEGATAYREWSHMISLDGVRKLFETAPHSEVLRAIQLEEDIAYCAGPNRTRALPRADERSEYGIVLHGA